MTFLNLRFGKQKIASNNHQKRGKMSTLQLDSPLKAWPSPNRHEKKNTKHNVIFNKNFFLISKFY